MLLFLHSTEGHITTKVSIIFFLRGERVRIQCDLVFLCTYSGHRGGVKEPGGHEGNPVWD